MSAEPDPQARFDAVIEMTALQWSSEPVLLRPSPTEGHSNDAWSIDDPSRGRCVLRVCWRGDRGRLITEAKVGRALPRAVGYPNVLGYGWTRDERDLSWLVTRRLAGVSLAEAWPKLSETQRTEAGANVAAKLRALHRWRPSATLTDRLLSWRSALGADDVGPDAILGSTISPLPMPRVRLLTDWARTQDWIDPDLIDAALHWLQAHPELAPELDQPGLAVTHGDLHLGNLWWDGRRVSGLLDLEWARLASPYLDLSRLTDEIAAERALGGEDRHEFLDAVLKAYPDLYLADLADRLRYTRLAYQLRQLVAWGPPSDREPAPDHPLRLIADLLDF